MKKNKKNNHEPMRTCVACRRKKTKKELVRLVMGDSGKPEVDESGKKSGRGVNICPSIECFDIAVQRNAFARSWKTKLDQESLEQLRTQFEKVIESRLFRGGAKSVTVRVSKDTAESTLGVPVTRKPVEDA